MKSTTATLSFLSVVVMCACAANTPPEPGLPNPASVYCEEHGGVIEIREDAAGNQQGVCVFPDGSECDEWAYYRGECGPGDFPIVH